MARPRGLRRHPARTPAEPSVHVVDGDRAKTLKRSANLKGWAMLSVVTMLSSSGCIGAAAISTVAPAVAAGGAQIIGAQVAMRDAKGTGVPSDDQSDRCDQLLRVPPGVEEVRKTLDGVIESRQWKVAQS